MEVPEVVADADDPQAANVVPKNIATVIERLSLVCPIILEANFGAWFLFVMTAKLFGRFNG